MSSEPRPTLLVFADSLAYYGPKGGLPSDDPRIWPNIVAAQLGWDLELIGRIGWTCRDIWWAATQDPRAWAALPRAGAVVFATCGMDSLPSPLPTALRELIRYVRPPWLRRWVRDGYGWAQPRFSPIARAALPPHLHAARNLRHAGLAVTDTVDFHQALEADAHHAERRTRRPRYWSRP